jgi:hypothetical protein
LDDRGKFRGLQVGQCDRLEIGAEQGLGSLSNNGSMLREALPLEEVCPVQNGLDHLEPGIITERRNDELGLDHGRFYERVGEGINLIRHRQNASSAMRAASPQRNPLVDLELGEFHGVKSPFDAQQGTLSFQAVKFFFL